MTARAARMQDQDDEPSARRRSRRPTIHDVAQRAGVSKSLVSLVLRGSAKVSDARRRAVLEAVDELGYRPNAIARGLVENRTRMLGVMAADLHNAFFIELLDGVLDEAESLGYWTLLGTGKRSAEREAGVVESLLTLPVDGVVICSPLVPVARLEELSRSVPMVVTGCDANSLDRVDIVTDDDRAGAALAVEHLAGLGHRRIVHLTGGNAPGSAERRRGYEETMRQHGLGALVRVVPGEFTDEGGYQAAKRVFTEGDQPSAVFAANDVAAVGALTAIEEAGYAVPDDVSLVGYDNTSLSAMSHIALTTIDQPRLDMGRLAVRTLDDRLSGRRSEPCRHVLEPRLVRRRTTAPPKDHTW